MLYMLRLGSRRVIVSVVNITLFNLTLHLGRIETVLVGPPTHHQHPWVFSCDCSSRSDDVTPYVRTYVGSMFLKSALKG